MPQPLLLLPFRCLGIWSAADEVQLRPGLLPRLITEIRKKRLLNTIEVYISTGNDFAGIYG